MRKSIKITLAIFLILILGILVAVWVINEDPPEIHPTAEADELAQKMMQSMNPAAWDTTHYLQWTFMGNHHYVWDRKHKQFEMKWDEKRVVLNEETKEGLAFENGEALNGEAAQALKDKAWSSFVNDNFWVIAPLKAFDAGVTRSIATDEDGQSGLMVHYSSGGVTPGDKYLWLLDENSRPKAFKMWVKIIPVGGLEASWEGWTQLSTGAWAPTLHKVSSTEISIDNLKGSHKLEALDLDYDPFAG